MTLRQDDNYLKTFYTICDYAALHKIIFYVIILHDMSIVFVCLFWFIEQESCVTAVTIHGCVAAIWNFERFWT